MPGPVFDRPRGHISPRRDTRRSAHGSYISTPFPKALLGAVSRLLALTLTLTSTLACSKEGSAPEPQETAGHAKAVHSAAPLDPILHVPVGPVTIGSPPGTPGRNPSLDPLPYAVELGPFRIDRTARKNTDGSYLTVTSQTAAEALCASGEGRLCTELEWERACRGELGLELESQAEWTASSFGPGSEIEGQAVTRQKSGEAPLGCSARRAAPKEGARVRCCYGAPNAPRVKEPVDELPVFKPHPLEKEALVELLAAHPETRELSKSASLFPEDAAATVLARGPGDTKGFELTTTPVEWTPRRGVRLLVIAGKSEGDTAFVVAFFKSPGGYVFASSFVMRKEKGPVALAYAQSIRPRIHFSTCWGCPGETGKALFREPESIVMLQP